MQSYLENMLAATYKVEHAPTLWHSNSILGISTRKKEHLSPPKTCVRIFTSVLLIIAKYWKQYPSKRTDSITQMDYYSAVH